MPKLGFVHVLFTQTFGRVGGKLHNVLGDTKEFEVAQVHIIHSFEFSRELFGGQVNMRVVHIEHSDAHQTKELARFFIAVDCAVFCQSQRQVAVASGFGRVHLVVVRAVLSTKVVHGFGTIFIKHHGREHTVGIVGQMARGLVY